MVPLLTLASALAVGGACQQDRLLGLRGQAFDLSAPTEAALAPIADATIRGTTPNTNFGADSGLRIVQWNRFLVQFDEGQIAAAVGPDSLAYATLIMTVTIPRTTQDTQPHTLRVHRMLQGWTEAGTTWNCASDGNTANDAADCAGADAWDMTNAPPFDSVPTSQFITPHETGPVRVDVTSDVRAFLAGMPNVGWIVKPTAEPCAGGETFGSRESASPPQLVLSLVPRAGTHDTGLAPIADTWIDQAAPNAGHSGAHRLSVSGVAPSAERALIRFSQDSIVAAIGTEALAHATLEVTVVGNNDQWSGGRGLDVHRVTHAWTEAGATWNCAIDAVPGDGGADCSGATEWSMSDTASGAYGVPFTARTPIANGQLGLLQFDVTADVQAFLAGTPNDGWMIKKSLEYANGRVELASRDTSATSVWPRLVLSLVPQDTSRPAVPATLGFTFDTTRLVEGSVSTFERDLFMVSFKPGASGAVVRLFLSRFLAQIVGGVPSAPAYVVRVPDPVTQTAWHSLLSSMLADSNVAYVLPMRFRWGGTPEINTRWPGDGPHFLHSSWLQSPSQGQQALSLARFPLAWGCETGTYGSPPVDMGVIDWHFDDAEDMNGAVAGRLTPFGPRAGSAKQTTLLTLEREDVQQHGLWVSSVAAANTGNDTGIAGAAWSARIHQYALSNGDSVWADPYVDDIVDDMLAKNVHVLFISADFTADSVTLDAEVAQWSGALRRFLDGSARNILVKSAGNDGHSGPPADYASGLGSHFVILAAVARLLASDSAEASRIIMATALNATGSALWQAGNEKSNDVSGVGAVAAPGQNVAVLTANGGDAVQSGTSVSAPLVAAAAELLLTFDTALDGSAAKDLLSGDRYVTFDGRIVSQRPRVGYGVVLDAYNALALAAADDPTTPICAFPVSVSVDGAGVVVEHPSGADTYHPSGLQYVSGVSVAQGGRLISVQGLSDTTVSVILNNRGAELQRIRGKRRVYLERDTVDFHGEGYVFDRIGPSGALSSVDVVTPQNPRGYVPAPGFMGVSISPDGASAVVSGNWEVEGQTCDPDSSGRVGHMKVSVVSVPAGTLIRSLQDRSNYYWECGPNAPPEVPQWSARGSAWSHSGSVVAVAWMRDDGSSAPEGHLDVDSVSGVSESATFASQYIDSPVFIGDDSAVWATLTGVSDGEVTSCRRSERSAAAPGIEITGVSVSACLYPSAPWISIPNAPRRGAAADSRPRASRQVAGPSAGQTNGQPTRSPR